MKIAPHQGIFIYICARVSIDFIFENEKYQSCGHFELITDTWYLYEYMVTCTYELSMNIIAL
jgi:hypothetical protein